MFCDYCKVLGVEHNASDMEIKRAFRKRAKDTHPEFNSASDAEQQFITLNEAYDILIHHKTRELFEEDLNTFHNPEAYPPYKHWIIVARERATVHSRLPYKEFTRTKFYQGTHTSPYLLFVAELFASIVLILVPYVLMVRDDSRVFGVFSLFIALPAGIFMLVQSLSGFSAMKKFKSPGKVNKKGDAKIQKT
ncbi:MAG: J domain-containing protein [Sphingobacteriales bacterium]|nr:MAG: J domain-containing protein [Sphingobacteriales bacterium]